MDTLSGCSSNLTERHDLLDARERELEASLATVRKERTEVERLMGRTGIVEQIRELCQSDKRGASPGPVTAPRSKRVPESAEEIEFPALPGTVATVACVEPAEALKNVETAEVFKTAESRRRERVQACPRPTPVETIPAQSPDQPPPASCPTQPETVIGQKASNVRERQSSLGNEDYRPVEYRSRHPCSSQSPPRGVVFVATRNAFAALEDSQSPDPSILSESDEGMDAS